MIFTVFTNITEKKNGVAGYHRSTGSDNIFGSTCITVRIYKNARYIYIHLAFLYICVCVSIRIRDFVNE